MTHSPRPFSSASARWSKTREDLGMRLSHTNATQHLCSHHLLHVAWNKIREHLMILRLDLPSVSLSESWAEAKNHATVQLCCVRLLFQIFLALLYLLLCPNTQTRSDTYHCSSFVCKTCDAHAWYHRSFKQRPFPWGALQNYLPLVFFVSVRHIFFLRRLLVFRPLNGPLTANTIRKKAPTVLPQCTGHQDLDKQELT